MCTVKQNIVMSKHMHISAGQAVQQALHIVASLFIAADWYSWLGLMCLQYCKCKSEPSYNEMLTADAQRGGTT